MARTMSGISHVLVAVTVVFAITAAGCDTEITAEEFDTSCTADADCVVITVGDVCKCGCEAGAINKKDHETYKEERLKIACSAVCEECTGLPEEGVCRTGICSVQ